MLPVIFDWIRLEELVANAFGTGRPPIRIRVRSLAEGRAVVEVTHGLGDEPTEGAPDADVLHLSSAGRTVVESMASRWGSRPTGAGVMAWFEIDDEPSVSADADRPAPALHGR